MNGQQLAALLNGREYGRKIITLEEKDQARADGLVVLIGYSDDGMDFYGAISDQVGCYDGGTAYLNKEGLLTNECEDDECPHFAKLKASAATIEALWCKEDGYSWTYKTDIPHHTFEVVEGEERYCRGIVFALADVKDGAA